MKHKQCIVIGAGVAGLSSAALLASKGYDVMVIEQSSTYGGKVGERMVGHAYFDSGPSVCTDTRVIDLVYTKCGKNPRDYWQYQKLLENTAYFWPSDDTRYTMPIGTARIERSIVHTFHERPKKVRAYSKRTQALYALTARYYIDRRIALKTLFHPKAFVGAMKLLPLLFSTVNTRNSRYFSNPKTVQLFNRYATYSGSNPYKAPAVLQFAAIPELTQGVYFPDGGMRSIATGLYKLCEDVGVKFLFNKKITSLQQSNNFVTSVRVNKQQFLCDTLLYSGDVVRLYELLGDTTHKHKIAQTERSTSAIVFYWEVRGTFKQFGLHNVIFSDDYQKEYAQLQRGEIPQDPTIYLNITSKVDRSHAAKGTENWFVMVNVPAGTKDVAILALKDVVKAKLETMLGGYITILHEHTMSPTDIATSTSAWQGAIYGQASNSLQSLLFRPKNHAKTPYNIYRVGGTVHPGGGIPLAVRSALITTDML